MMNNSEILIYQNSDGKIKIDVCLEDETVWLTQEHLAQLFGKSKKTISEHIRNIFAEGELGEQLVVRKFRTTTRHGAMAGKTQTKEVQFYNLDLIISRKTGTDLFYEGVNSGRLLFCIDLRESVTGRCS